MFGKTLDTTTPHPQRSDISTIVDMTPYPILKLHFPHPAELTSRYRGPDLIFAYMDL